MIRFRDLSFVGVLGFSILLGGFVAAARAWEVKEAATGRQRVYFGTYTRGDSKGIYVAQLDMATGKLSEPRLAGETKNPSFLAIHPNRRFLYAVGEISEFQGEKTGAVTAFAIDKKTGDLTKLNAQSSRGTGPCHIVVDATGSYALTANYGGGSVAALPINDDGHLAQASGFVQHEGSSVNPKRQKAPHAHSINLDKANRYAFAADLGLDKVLVYRLDHNKGTLTPHGYAAVKPGAGPRHFAFHPTGQFAYVINELHSTVTAFNYDPAHGKLTPIQTITTLPEDYQGGNSTAEVQVHPSGKFLYGSNRGHNSLAIFRIDQATGKLTADGHQSTGGKTPRNFGIDPTGRFILAANQQSDNVVVLRVNQKTGELTPTGQEITVPTPVCVKFVVIE